MNRLAKTTIALRNAIDLIAPDYPTSDDRQTYARAMECALLTAAAAEQSEKATAELAQAIHAVLAGVARHDINPAYAVPLLLASAELLTAHRDSGSQTALDAARYELETLLPNPTSSPRPTAGGFDVAAGALSLKSRSKT